MGKDGMQWWIGEVEDNQDPLQINRVKCRCLGWYTNTEGGSKKDLPTDDMPWAIVLQPTTQAGNDGQGESSGQLQPGAIVMGFFLDGEEAQMPVIMGVMRVIKSSESRDKTQFVFTGEGNRKTVNFATATASNVTIGDKDKTHANENTSVQTAGTTEQKQSSPTNPNNLATKTATPGSAPASLSSKPRAAADGVGGPAKTLVNHITSLVEDVAKQVIGLVKRDGVYIRISDGVPVSLEKITSSVKNAFMGLGAQAVAAMREYLNELASLLSKGAALIATFTGIPTATMLLIKSAIELILKQLCILDDQILPFAMIAISPFEALIDLALSKAMSYAELVESMLSELAQHLVSSYNLIVCKVLQIVSAAEKIINGIGAAKKIIDTWKQGSKIFAEGLDLQKLGLMDFIQLVLFLFNLFDLGCNRKRQKNKNKGWVPLVGSTECTDDEEARKVMSILRGRSDCGLGADGWDNASNVAADFISQIYTDASPFLTAARTELSGGYTQHTGTPGRWSETKRMPSGTTHTSIHTDDRQYGEYLASKAGTDEKKTLDRSNSSTGKPIVGDHSTYAGSWTNDITKDLCYLVHGDEIHTVAGDFHLKVDGNFHLEVGGALMIHAVGAPQFESTNGEKLGNTQKAQKHNINFGSDVDINASGATMKLNATEMTVTGMDTKLGAPTGTLSIDSPSTSIRGGDIIISANNTITETCGTLFQNINFPQLPRAKSGIFVNCAGPVDYVLTPAPSFDPLPRFSINTVGPFLVNCAAGGASFNVAAGVFNVAVAAGAITMTASAAVTITAGAVMTLTAAAAVNIIGATINLN